MLNAQAERPTDVYIIQYYTLCPDRGLRNFTRSSAADYSRPAEHSRAQASTAEHSRPQPSTAEHRRAQPSTADYGRAPEHSRAADTADYGRLRPTTAEHPSTAEQPTTADHKRKINRRVAELAKLPDCCHGTHVVTLRPFRQWDYRHFRLHHEQPRFETSERRL